MRLDELAARGIEPVARACVAGGLSPAASSSRAAMASACAVRLMRDGCAGCAPARAFHVPGRIEVFGKHTDYAGGRSLLAACERGFVFVTVPRDDAVVRVVREQDGDVRECTLMSGATQMAEIDGSDGDWAVYPLVTARRLARNFGLSRGVWIALACDLPPSSGLSSSSAIVVGTALALLARHGCLEEVTSPPARAFGWARRVGSGSAERLDFRTDAFAEYLGCVENGQTYALPAAAPGAAVELGGDAGVGTFGGSEDHAAILTCAAGQLSQCAFCPTRTERRVPVAHARAVFVVGVSGHLAAKAAGARKRYNDAARAAAEAVRLWARATGRTQDRTLADALASSPAAIERLGAAIAAAPRADGAPSPDRLRARITQFDAESHTLVPGAADAFARRDWAALGRLAAESHALGEAALGNLVGETALLAELALALGAHAASPFGAGFGGSVWAWVDAERADEFSRAWRDAYARALADGRARALAAERAAVGEPSADDTDGAGGVISRSSFFVTAAGPGAFEITAPVQTAAAEASDDGLVVPDD